MIIINYIMCSMLGRCWPLNAIIFVSQTSYCIFLFVHTRSSDHLNWWAREVQWLVRYGDPIHIPMGAWVVQLVTCIIFSLSPQELCGQPQCNACHQTQESKPWSTVLVASALTLLPNWLTKACTWTYSLSCWNSECHHNADNSDSPRNMCLKFIMRLSHHRRF